MHFYDKSTKLKLAHYLLILFLLNMYGRKRAFSAGVFRISLA